MPILSLVSNSGLTAYSNKLSKVLFAYNNKGYSGKDPLWHSTTAWVTAASFENIDQKMIVDILLAGPGGGGSSGSDGGGTNGGGGGAGGYLYASGVEVSLDNGSNRLPIQVGMARGPMEMRAGRYGYSTSIGPFTAFGGAGGSGGNIPDGTDQHYGRGPGRVGYYNPGGGTGSSGGNYSSPSVPIDYTAFQGGHAGGAIYDFGGGYLASGGGGGAGGAGGNGDGAGNGGAGGTGVNLAFSPGPTMPFGGGGGGGFDNSRPPGFPAASGSGGAGGSPGGGAGNGPAGNGFNASGYGCGGGGCGRYGIKGGRGGNGFAMIKYRSYYANSTFINVGASNGQGRGDMSMEYFEGAGFRTFFFRPTVGPLSPDDMDINVVFCQGYLHLPNRFNYVIDQSTGLNGRPHRLNYREADRVGLTTFDQSYFPIPSAFSPFSTNGWGISLNEDSPTNSLTNPYSWLTYPNNLSDFADIGTGDFMLQAYVKKTGYYADSQTGRSQPILFLAYANGNTLEFGNFVDPGVNNFGYMGVAQAGVPITGTVAASDNVWYKVRIQRSAGTISVFVDDVRIGLGTDATNYSGTPISAWIGFNGYASAWDVRAFVGQISGLVFRKGSTNVFDLRDSNNFRNTLNPKVVIPRLSDGGGIPRPSCFITGSLDTYSSNNFPSNDKISSIYWTGSATVNTSITWDGYYPDGVINTQPTYVFCANTGDFCVDGWVYTTANNNQVVFTMGSGYEDYFTIYANPAQRRLAFVAGRATPSTTLYGPSGGLIANTWNHFVVQREGGSVKVFTNGELGDTQGGSGAATYNFNDATVYPVIAGRVEGSDKLTGYTSQIRYSRFARSLYSGTSYTVPRGKVTADSASLFINGYAGSTGGPPIWDATQKNNFVQAGNWNTVTTSPVNTSVNSGAVRFASTSTSKFPNQYINNGSLYSAGLGHYIRFVGPNNQRNFKFGTADFCVEGWWTADYVPSQQTLIDFRELTSDVAFAIKIDTSNRILLVVVNTTRITSAPITLGTPVHIAVERVSGVTSLYINGVRSGVTYADINSYIARPTRPDLFTDGTNESTESFVGSMHMIRVTKDYPRYSANFSPGPTAIFDTIGLNQTYFPYN